MPRLTKAELKVQKEIFEVILKKETLTKEEIEYVYDNINIAYIDNLSRGVFFTPGVTSANYGLASDFAYCAHRAGNICDVFAGIGGLSYAMKEWYNDIQSLTCIEMNPLFVAIGKKLLPEANWICSDAFNEQLWTDITKDLPDNKFDIMISNPPFGKMSDDIKESCKWVGYTGAELEVAGISLCLKKAKQGYFILPAGTSEFKQYPYYQRTSCRKIDKLRKDLPEHFFFMEMMMDCQNYTGWKNLSNITVVAAEINMDESEYL